MNKLKISPLQKFYKIHGKIGVLKIHSQSKLLAYKLLPQTRHQHLFRNNYIVYILLPKKRQQHLFENNYIIYILLPQKKYQHFFFLTLKAELLPYKLLPQKRHCQNYYF